MSVATPPLRLELCNLSISWPTLFIMAYQPVVTSHFSFSSFSSNDQKLPTCLPFHQRNAHSSHNCWINDQVFHSSKWWYYFLPTSKYISWVSVSVILALYWLGIRLILNFTLLHTSYFVAAHLHVQDYLCRMHSQEAGCSILPCSRNVPPLTPCWPKLTLHLAPTLEHGYLLYIHYHVVIWHMQCFMSL